MYTSNDVDQETLRVLMQAAPGKDPHGRPKGLCTYQICSSFDDQMADYFIGLGGVGGAGGGGGTAPSFTQVVQYSLRRLSDRGFVRHSYMDTRGLVFEIKGHRDIRPSYPVMAVYQYSGDHSARPTGSSTEVVVGARSEFGTPPAPDVQLRNTPMQIEAGAVRVRRS